jgi:hypothetical protein
MTSDSRRDQGCRKGASLFRRGIASGLHEVHDEEGFVSLYAPKTHGDDTTTRKVDMDLIASVAVTDIEW